MMSFKRQPGLGHQPSPALIPTLFGVEWQEMIIPTITILLAAALPAPQAEVKEIDKAAEQTGIAFDHPIVTTDGQPVELNACEFIFRHNPISAVPVPPPIRVLKDMQAIVKGENVYAVPDLFATVPVGEYDITVRVRSVGGKWSDVSNILHRKIVSKKPATPLNLREKDLGL